MTQSPVLTRVPRAPCSRSRMTAASRRTAGDREFIALLAMATALGALGVAILLPALAEIRAELGLPPDSTAVAGLVSAYFIGLASGQIVFGPISDRIGRRRTLFLGFGVYIVGALAATMSTSLTLLLASRLVWGLGGSVGRVVTMAAIRDTHSGEQMSRAMSLIMAVFLLVPVVAPLLGAGIVAIASWRWVFGVCVIAAIAMSLWALRLPETLPPERRLELRFGRIVTAARYVLSDRRAVGYTLAMTVLFGAFMSYLASSEIIIDQAFGRPGAFPFVFAGLAIVMGVGMTTNARIVERTGTRTVSNRALLLYVGCALALVAVAIPSGGRPPLWLFLVGMSLLLIAHALIIPNYNSIAMTNMAPVAGTASAVIGSTQMAGGAALGALVDQSFDGTVLPLWSAFAVFGIVALGIVLVVERGHPLRPDRVVESGA